MEFLDVRAPLVEHLRASGAKNPEDAAAKLAEQEIETFEDVLRIDPADFLKAMQDFGGMKGGSATKVKEYCRLFRAAASAGAAPAPAAEGGGGGGGAAAEEEKEEQSIPAELRTVLEGMEDVVQHGAHILRIGSQWLRGKVERKDGQPRSVGKPRREAGIVG